MPKYKYTAVDADGKNVKDTIFATNMAEFNAVLKQKGEYAVSVKEIAEADTSSRANANAISMKDLSILCKQFSTMLGAGITIVKSLDVLYQQQEKEKLKNILLKVYEQVQVGKSLSKALASTDGAFPNFMVSMVEAGEMSGSIEQIMERLSQHYEKQVALKNKVSSAMIYPIVLVVVGFTVSMGLFIFVMPSLMGMFGELGDLPALTRGLMAMSDFCRSYWYLIIGFVVILVLVFGVFKNTKIVKQIFDRLCLYTPKVGKLYAVVMSANFCRTMYSVFSSGMSLITSLELTTNVLNNTVVTEKMSGVLDEIRSGGNLSSALHRTGIFPQMMVTMINVGEESGALDEILAKTADFYDVEADNAIQKMVSLLEPVMILLIGGLVGTVIIGIMLPVFGMYENVA